MQSFEGLKDCVQDHTVLRRVEELGTIIQPFEGPQMQSFNPRKDHAVLGRVEGSHTILQTKGLRSPSNDCVCNHSNPSSLPRIVSVIIARVEGSRVILQAFKGLQI